MTVADRQDELQASSVGRRECNSTRQRTGAKRMDVHVDTYTVSPAHGSLKLVPFKSLGAVSYSPSIVTLAVSVAVCEILSAKEWCDLENRVRVRSRSL